MSGFACAEFGEAEEASFAAAVAASLETVDAADVSPVECADADGGGRRRRPLGADDSVTLAYTIAVAIGAYDDGAALGAAVASELAAAVSSGAFAAALVAAADASSVLASATPGAVETSVIVDARPSSAPTPGWLIDARSSAGSGGGGGGVHLTWRALLLAIGALLFFVLALGGVCYACGRRDKARVRNGAQQAEAHAIELLQVPSREVYAPPGLPTATRVDASEKTRTSALQLGEGFAA